MNPLKKLFVNPLRGILGREVSLLSVRRDQDILAWRQRKALEATGLFVEQYLGDVRAVRSKVELLDIAVDAVPAQKEGLYCEFGVFKGATISRMAKRRPGHTFYGFDSFEGLPTDWKPGCGKGSFDLAGSLPSVPLNVELVKGWYEQSLPPFLAAHSGPALLLHIDCDLYSSTKCVFDQLADRIGPGTVIVFDEYFNYPGWEQGEHKAWLELVATRLLRFEYLGYNELNEQLAVRVL